MSGALEGRVEIVTGGANGIGAAIARLFAQEGAAVVVNDLGTSAAGEGTDGGPVQQAVARIQAGGGSAIGDAGDIADTATGERLVDLAISNFGRLDIVVNTAGILRDRMIFNMSPEEWDAVIRVHLRGHFSTIRPACAYFRSQRNVDANYRIINFTSGSGLHGAPGQPNYAAAKMGVVGLTASVANAMHKYGVTANAISPHADTRMTASIPKDRLLVEVEGSDEFAPESIAPVAAYLASERSAWITGRVVSVQGRELGLYNIPEVIASETAPRAWDFGLVADAMERSFRPLADGLDRSVF